MNNDSTNGAPAGLATIAQSEQQAIAEPLLRAKTSTIRTNDGLSGIIIPLSEVIETPIKWLLPGFIPFSSITILEGNPGEGKSHITSYLAAKITSGKPIRTDDEPAALPAANVLLMAAEDGYSQVIKTRIRAAGGDEGRVILLEVNRDGVPGDPPTIPSDISLIEETICEKGVKLLIIDPLNCFIADGYSVNVDQSIRRVLTPLKEMAEATGVSVLIVRHLRKQSGRASIYAGAGSIGLAGAARSVLLVGRNPHDRTVRVLASTKNNWGERPASLAFELKKTDQGPVVSWLGEVDLEAEDLVLVGGKCTKNGRNTKLAAARLFLLSALANGTRPQADLKVRWESQGLSEKTVQRAKQALRIVSTKASDKDGGWMWSLPAAPSTDSCEILAEPVEPTDASV